MTTTTALDTAFQVTLNAADLERSLRFYRALLGREPDEQTADGARFELAEPPLILGLTRARQKPGGTLNHVGFRLADSAALVEVQRRLEEAGFPSQRQDGVECCYSRQTKFWVTDPDGNLWELYVLEEDVSHSGFEDVIQLGAPKSQAVVWEHRLTEPQPPRIPHGDGSVDEVRLEGTVNATLANLRPAWWFAEVARVLRPGGKVTVHGLLGDRAVDAPGLPGLAALVQRVPSVAEATGWLQCAGFGGLLIEHRHEVVCFSVAGVDLFELTLAAWRTPAGGDDGPRRVVYKGPFERVVADDGTVFPRGVAVEVGAATVRMLEQGAAAGQFSILPASR